jgi:hypothetical protein
MVYASKGDHQRVGGGASVRSPDINKEVIVNKGGVRREFDVRFGAHFVPVLQMRSSSLIVDYIPWQFLGTH